MKKELFIHFSFLIALLVFITLIRGWWNFSYWPFWLGGILGTLLPDTDHFIYVFWLRPYELTSQRAQFMLQKKDFLRIIELLYETRGERTKLIFHSATFQIIFWILTFWVLTSSGSFLGRGLVMAFSLHLLVDQFIDMKSLGSLANWFIGFPFALESDKMRNWWLINIGILLIFGLFL